MSHRIQDLPADQRPRQRMLELGADSLTDIELLAIILRTGTYKRSAMHLAQQLLADYGGFRGLDRRSAAELCNMPGLGPAKVAQLKAALAIGKRLLAQRDPAGKALTNSREVFEHVGFSIRDRTREVFIVLFLTIRNRLIKERMLFEGTLTESLISPREVIKEALNESAARLIFVHNHPSHDPSPSQDDRQLTTKLKNACALVEIGVLDHIIVGGERFFSFADEGLL